MSDSSDSIVVDTTKRIFSDLCDPQTVNAAHDDAWKSKLWAALEENGLTLAWIPEDRGGVGASMADGFDVIRVAGQYAEPVALSETLLAGWLLARAGQQIEANGPVTVAPMRYDETISLREGKLSGSARAVAYAKDATHIAVFAQNGDGNSIAMVSPDNCKLADRRTNMGGERYDVDFDNVTPDHVYELPGWLTRDTFNWLGAAVRASQMTGALETILATSTQYAQEREAFGRTISKFQAVQHNLAELGGEVAAALAASGSAADTVDKESDNHDALFLEIASAKIRIGEAVNRGATIAHQVHGAIGYTGEHILQRFTRRMWGWRDDFGNESEWAVELGNMVAREGADELWPKLATR
ncbi:MAG: acyl-CoA dehydrogenase family protein [Pseudomonadota bacterium]